MNNPNDIAPGNNPDRLTNAQVGEGYRLLTEEEVSARHRENSRYAPEIQSWLGGGWDDCWAGRLSDHTYRVPISAGSFMPKPRVDKDALLAEMAYAIERLMVGSLFCSYDDQPPQWQRIIMPSESAMTNAKNTLARYKEATQ